MTANVRGGADVVVEVTGEKWTVCATSGDRHLGLLGEDIPSAAEHPEMVVEGRGLGVQAAVMGPSVLLRCVLMLDVLVCAGVSLGLSDEDESFGVCWIIKYYSDSWKHEILILYIQCVYISLDTDIYLQIYILIN